MKKLQIITLLYFVLFYSARGQTVNQEICYFAENANEVFLVWGVNEWQQPDKKDMPQGSYIKDNLVHTLMTKKEDGLFSVNIKVKPGTKIDYVFWITKGPRDVSSDIWDVNVKPLKDYHNVAFNDNTTFIHSKIIIKPKQQLSVLDFAWTILFFLLFAVIAFFSLKRFKYKDMLLKPGPAKIIIASGGVVLVVLFLIRASVSSLGWDLYYHPFKYLSQFFIAGFYDHLYMVFLTLLFVLLVYLFRKYSRVQKSLVFLFLSLGLVSVIAGILNIRIVDMLGKPFNYRWFYYSGFLSSSDSKAALSSNISVPYILNIVAICIAALIAGILVIYFTEWLLQRYKIRKLALISFIFINLGYTIVAQISLKDHKWNYDNLANPVVAFLESMNPFTENSELYTMEIPDSLNVFGKPKNIDQKTSVHFSDKIKNVVIVVLESTPSKYILPYDQKFKITPELEKYLPQSIVFDNMYAHAPATNKSMVSLMASVYPWLSYTSITQEHPDINIPTLSSELKTKGYRTAFFNSGDNRFQKANEFLANHKFDEIKDCKSLVCASQFEEKDEKWDPLDGMDDECAGNALRSWIKEDSSKPFFAMMWTYQTHYPYYASGTEKSYTPNDSVLNRYLNAVNHSDKVLGEIIEELKATGLFESTLVVVVGDHGEAFGEHDQITHASKIYEENLHIPFILINPSFKGERKADIGGMVDAAPTIMNVIGFDPNEKWQGQSLFEISPNKRTYFFCPWSDHLFGYREGNKKYIYNATKDITEVYDLEKDPNETKNLATEEDIIISHQKLGAWVQYQDKFMNDILKLN
jgi:phosphoglycerol transferase MdoB-like AlkP superfamily enzyme